MRRDAPPPLSRRVVSWAARRLDTPDLVDTAAELFEEERERRGERSARRWYRRQARSALWRAVLPRSSVRDARAQSRAGTRAERARSGASVAAAGTSRLGGLSGLSIDAKLGIRMLGRYPGITAIGGLAMAFAIVVGAGTFEFIGDRLNPRLPLPDGDRIVGLRYWDRAENRVARPVADDVLVWRDALATVEDVGAFQLLERNLWVGGQASGPVEVARISPAAFRVVRVGPLLGRGLVEGDAGPGAPPVVVLGYRLWHMRFGGDASVVGRTVRLGEDERTVVGVMPEGFGFPVHHSLWIPLAPGTGEVGGGDALFVFGRLASGATLEAARAEAVAVTTRMARSDPERFENLTPEVLPYVPSLMSFRISLALRAMLHQLNVFGALFVMLVAANLALLMYARAATRERELLVRSALGASRRRIVTQLVVEALVLGAAATALGLVATGPAHGWLDARLEALGGGPPEFWTRTGVSPATAAYAVFLTVLGALIAGGIPGLKATCRNPDAALRQATAGGGGLRLGGIWTGVLVAQIAATVVFTAGAFLLHRQAARSAAVESNFPAEQYLAARIEMDRDATDGGSSGEPGRARDSDRGHARADAGDSGAAEARFRLLYASRVRELERRLDEDPSVAGVTLAARLPVMAHPSRTIEVEGGIGTPLPPGRAGHRVAFTAVDTDFFEVFGAPIVAGRAFDARDVAGGVAPIVVDQLFVAQVLGNRSAVGRRVRYVDAGGEPPGPWQEIVGVVRDLMADEASSLDLEEPPAPRIYHPLEPAAIHPLHVAAHVRGDARAAAAALHAIAGTVSPALTVHDVQTLDRATTQDAAFWNLFASMILAVSAIALILSLVATYAVMSFTVSRRRREIGVRVALGADARRVVSDTFRTPLSQVAAGVATGCVLVGGMVWVLTDARVTGRVAVGDGALLLGYGLGMVCVCALACVGPVIRALRVQPAEALGAEQ